MHRLRTFFLSVSDLMLHGDLLLLVLVLSVLLFFLKFLKTSNQSSFKLSVNILTYFKVEAIFFVSLIE